MEGVTKDTLLGPTESELKIEEAEENLPKTEEHGQIITEAEPLACIKPADHVHDQIQHPLLKPSYVDGKIFALPEGWVVEQRPRTSVKYLGKVDKFYYEPGTNRQFRTLRAAHKHVEEMKKKQNEQQPPQPRPENDQASGQKYERKLETLELGDESETGARSRFRRLKDVHKFLRARKGQQNKQKTTVVNGEQPEIDEHEQIITDAEPLSCLPPADHVYSQFQLRQYPLLIPRYFDGKIFRLPEGWHVERRPRTSLKYIGRVDKFYYEPGTNRQFRSWKAAQQHVEKMKGKKNDHQPPHPRPENDQELSQRQPETDYGQKSEHKPVTLDQELTPILAYESEHSKVSHEKDDENLRDEESKKRKQTLCIEFDSPNLHMKAKWILTDAESDHESNVQTSVVTLGEQQTDAKNEQWNTIVGHKQVPEVVKDSWVTETVDSIKNKAPEL